MSINFNPLKLLPHGIQRNVEALITRHASKLPVVKTVAVALGALALSVKIYYILEKRVNERMTSIENEKKTLWMALMETKLKIYQKIWAIENSNDELNSSMTTAIDTFINAYNTYTPFIRFLRSINYMVLEILGTHDISRTKDLTWVGNWLKDFHSNVNTLISAFLTRECNRLETAEIDINFLDIFFKDVKMETITSLDIENNSDQLKLNTIYSYINNNNNNNDNVTKFNNLIEVDNLINDTIDPNLNLNQELLKKQKATILRLYKIREAMHPMLAKLKEIHHIPNVYYSKDLISYLESIKASIKKDFEVPTQEEQA